MSPRQVILSVFVVVAVSCLAVGADWTRFRGPQGSGQAPDVSAPVQWSAEKNVRWKAQLPGAGASSPVVREGRIYVTCYAGYNRWERGTDWSAFALYAACLDAKGKELWRVKIPHDEKQLRGGHGGTRWHGYATGTPLVDELGVYLNYGNNGFYALDHDGKERWKVDLGGGTHGWGHGASPIACGELVVVNASLESGELQAYRRTDGQKVWATQIGPKSWSTPIVVSHQRGEQLVVNVRNGIAGFSAKDGSKIWEVAGGKDYQTTSPIYHDGVIYYSLRNTHRGIRTMALRLTGSGQVEEIWSSDRFGAVCGTPVLHEGRLYFAMIDGRTPGRQRGFYCVRASDGELLYHAQPDPMPETVYASPILTAGRVYYTALQAGTYVVDAGGEYKLLAHNVLEKTDRRATSTPVPLGADALLIRIDEMLYCIGKAVGARTVRAE